MNKKKIKVMILPRAAFDNFPSIEVADTVMVISIVSPGYKHPVIIGKNVYQFHFHDVTQRYIMSDNRTICPMEAGIAEQIAKVAVRHRDAKKWIIHCEAGISRSPGVAIGLSRYIDLEPDTKYLTTMFPCFNRYVRNEVEKALYKELILIGENPNE